MQGGSIRVRERGGASVTVELLVLLAVPAVALVAVAALERLIADTTAGATAVLALAVVATALDDAMPEPVVAGFTVTPPDVVFGLLATAAVARLLRSRDLTPGQIALTALSALVALSLLRGIATHGLQEAINESRTFLYAVFGSLYVALGDLSAPVRRVIGRRFLWAAVAILAVVGLRWAVIVAGLPTTGPFGRVEEPGGIRVIDNPATLQLAWALAMLVPLVLAGRLTARWQRRLLVALVPVLLLLNHRTIWIALLVGAAVVANRNPQIGRRLAGATVVLAVAGAVVITALQNLEESPLPQDPLSTETFLWRYEGWVDLIRSGDPSPIDVLVGRPLGGGYSREIFGYTVDVAPHNWYLQTYLRTGLIGLAAFLAAFVGAMVRLWRMPREDPDVLFSNEALVVGLAMQAIYLITWSPSLVHSIPLGIVVALAWRQQTVPVDRAVPVEVEVAR